MISTLALSRMVKKCVTSIVIVAVSHSPDKADIGDGSSEVDELFTDLHLAKDRT